MYRRHRGDRNAANLARRPEANQLGVFGIPPRAFSLRLKNLGISLPVIIFAFFASAMLTVLVLGI